MSGRANSEWSRRTMTRLCLAVVALVSAVATPLWAQSSFNGSWRATLMVYGQPCAISMVMVAARQHYDETLVCGPYRTWQRGTYRFVNGLLVRRVEDFEPKQRWIQDTGYSGHWEGNATPPGGTYRVAFTSPDTMVWRDQNFGGTITFHRVPL